MNRIEPSVTVKMWVEKPDAAEALMASDSENASDYTATGWLVVGGLVATLVTNLIIKGGAGPFGGIIDMALKVFKPESTNEHTQVETTPEAK